MSVTVLHHLHDPPSPSPFHPFLDDMDRDLRLHLDELVEDYRTVAAANGVGEAELRAMLADTELLDYKEMAQLYGVSVNIFLGWLRAAKEAAAAQRPLTIRGFIQADIDKSQTKVRLWRRGRAIMAGWRYDRLVPGTLNRTDRTPPGRASKARFAAA